MAYVAFAINLALLTLNVALLSGTRYRALTTLAIAINLYCLVRVFPIVRRRLRGE
jgi:hypothetical protein